MSLESKLTTCIMDLRSDTSSVPSPAMYDAIVKAPVGNDVFGEDTSVNELERRCAEMLGKEAALFVPTGTMANLLCIMVHCERLGSEFMVGDCTHIYNDEQGGSAQFARSHVRPLKNLPDGTFDINEMVAKIRDASDYHEPESMLVCLENTHNSCGGRVLSLDFMERVYTTAKEHGLAVHLDGARLWNAAVALNTDIKNISQYADSVNVCFSKGLGCPVGSLVAGTYKFTERCRRSRKALGGGLRQAGVLAGAVHYALDNVYPILSEDHRRAKVLAKGLKEGICSDVFHIDLDLVETNFVRLEQRKPVDLKSVCNRLKQVPDYEFKDLGERISLLVEPAGAHPSGIPAIRFVTYNGISDDDIDRVIRKCEYVFREFSA